MNNQFVQQAKSIINLYQNNGAKSTITQAYKYINIRTRETTRYQYQRLRYSAPAHPYKPIWVDPAEIKWTGISSNTFVTKYDNGLGQIVLEGWGKHYEVPLEETWKYQGLYQRFVEKKEWKNTSYVDHYKDKIQKGDSKYKSVDDFIYEWCVYYDKLYESIRDNGWIYKPNKPIQIYDKGMVKNKLEPHAYIDKDGTILLGNGQHRTSIAKILEIESMPMNVLCRHPQWQHIRDEIHNTKDLDNLDGGLKKYLSHPDMRDIIN